MFLTDQPVQRPERVSLQGEIGRMLVRAGSLISGLSEKVQMTITVAETSRICGGLGVRSSGTQSQLRIHFDQSRPKEPTLNPQVFQPLARLSSLSAELSDLRPQRLAADTEPDMVV